MVSKLSPDQLALYKRIDEILWADWDPIGVSKKVPSVGQYRWIRRCLSSHARAAKAGSERRRLIAKHVSPSVVAAPPRYASLDSEPPAASGASSVPE